MAESARSELAVLREDFRAHLLQDREDFMKVNASLAAMESSISEWTGAFCLAKWALGIGIPAILGALLSHVVRHW